MAPRSVARVRPDRAWSWARSVPSEPPRSGRGPPARRGRAAPSPTRRRGTGRPPTARPGRGRPRIRSPLARRESTAPPRRGTRSHTRAGGATVRGGRRGSSRFLTIEDAVHRQPRPAGDAPVVLQEPVPAAFPVAEARRKCRLPLGRRRQRLGLETVLELEGRLDRGEKGERLGQGQGDAVLQQTD